MAEQREPMTIYIARRIVTMDDSLPEATAVAVIGERIVAVGDVDSMQAWRDNRQVTIDETFKDKVLMPGFIDNHVHPFLGAILLPSEIIAPEDWRRPDGGVAKAANSPKEYQARLVDWISREAGRQEILISWGYQPSEHGPLDRAVLDQRCPGTPLVVIQRSYHELYLNSSAMEKFGLSEAVNGTHPQVNWSKGHFFETGKSVAMRKLMPHLMKPDWYDRGLGMLTQLCLQGGITTMGDLLFGGVDPDYEIAALDRAITQPGKPVRVVNVLDGRNFPNRAASRPMGPPGEPIDFAAGLPAMEALQSQQGKHVQFIRAAKLFADGAMFSQLMQMGKPGYADGHHGEWLMSPEVLAQGIKVFWEAGYQVHVHVNGDLGMDAVLDALQAAQQAMPRFDHRFTVHHLGFHNAAQTRRLAAMGVVASVNPYYIHALADSYSILGLGQDRASQIVRAGSLVKAGVPVSFHSDYPMAPAEPLFLAWCAATRTTRSGRVAAPPERLTLEQALRGITIDAAFALKMDHEIGSIVAGKKADFTVLESDPYDCGADGLKDLKIWGTVFEGQVSPLEQPAASVHAARAATAQAGPVRSRSANRLRMVDDAAAPAVATTARSCGCWPASPAKRWDWSGPLPGRPETCALPIPTKAKGEDR
ncbi:MAG: amidohydrolase [Burkholderiaceae bacterium]